MLVYMLLIMIIVLYPPLLYIVVFTWETIKMMLKLTLYVLAKLKQEIKKIKG